MAKLSILTYFLLMYFPCFTESYKSTNISSIFFRKRQIPVAWEASIEGANSKVACGTCGINTSFLKKKSKRWRKNALLAYIYHSPFVLFFINYLYVCKKIYKFLAKILIILICSYEMCKALLLKNSDLK